MRAWFQLKVIGYWLLIWVWGRPFTSKDINLCKWKIATEKKACVVYTFFNQKFYILSIAKFFILMLHILTHRGSHTFIVLSMLDTATRRSGQTLFLFIICCYNIEFSSQVTQLSLTGTHEAHNVFLSSSCMHIKIIAKNF